MFWTIVVIFLVLWFLGVMSNFTLGGFIHVLLLLVVAMILIRLIRGRR